MSKICSVDSVWGCFKPGLSWWRAAPGAGKGFEGVEDFAGGVSGTDSTVKAVGWNVWLGRSRSKEQE